MKKIIVFLLVLALVVPVFGAVKKAAPKPKAKVAAKKAVKKAVKKAAPKKPVSKKGLPSKIQAEPAKMIAPTLLSPESRIERAVEIPSKPQTYVSGGWGNIYEGGSGTNNWLSVNGSLSYGDKFNIWNVAGNYEATGKYGVSQIIYLTSGSIGGTVYESRYDLELNTIYPVVQFYGISGKLLLGAKYINLSNSIAPASFTGLNVGLVTTAKAFERNLLVRGFYSLPLIRTSTSPSVLGQPSQLFDYEASVDADLFSNPVLLGFSGEMMLLSAGGNRYYNAVFVRYFLM